MRTITEFPHAVEMHDGAEAARVVLEARVVEAGARGIRHRGRTLRDLAGQMVHL